MSSTTNDINPFTGKAFSGRYHSLNKTAQNLPVSRHLNKLLGTIAQHQVVVVVGETGSGKTTQLPKAIVMNKELSRGKKLALTQHRKLAAQSVSVKVHLYALEINTCRSLRASQRRWMCTLVGRSVSNTEAVMK